LFPVMLATRRRLDPTLVLRLPELVVRTETTGIGGSGLLSATAGATTAVARTRAKVEKACVARRPRRRYFLLPRPVVVRAGVAQAGERPPIKSAGSVRAVRSTTATTRTVRISRFDRIVPPIRPRAFTTRPRRVPGWYHHPENVRARPETCPHVVDPWRSACPPSSALAAASTATESEHRKSEEHYGRSPDGLAGNPRWIARYSTKGGNNLTCRGGWPDIVFSDQRGDAGA